MSETAEKLAPSGGLRVVIYAADSPRRAALRAIVAEAGHVVVASAQEADIVLADGPHPASEDRPVVSLGGDDQAGVLPRDADRAQIHAALRAVAAGLIVRLPGKTETGFRALHETNVRTLLTPREIEVLDAIGDGLTNKAIARRLDISLHTVKFHVEALFRKLSVRTRTQAVVKAWERRRDETAEL